MPRTFKTPHVLPHTIERYLGTRQRREEDDDELHANEPFPCAKDQNRDGISRDLPHLGDDVSGDPHRGRDDPGVHDGGPALLPGGGSDAPHRASAGWTPSQSASLAFR